MLKCSKCGETKNESEFVKRPNRKRGYHSHCKQCRHDYYLDNKKHILKTHKLYRVNNPEKEAVRHKLYYSKNRSLMQGNV